MAYRGLAPLRLPYVVAYRGFLPSVVAYRGLLPSVVAFYRGLLPSAVAAVAFLLFFYLPSWPSIFIVGLHFASSFEAYV
ncbi:hypothetical protein HPP92_018275 [Vanilla planifolia]|uniref:Uncharacterized protein n=1 Tax=Vanilla planifolia TaxID=51239 RepID=A0A835QH63_VANPL|nr:hypothetical protein HPP92_018275 [Vanilla planifolia]